jgi:hypothetical protein
MQNYENFLNHYRFTQEDTKILKTLQPRMEALAEEFIDGFYNRTL